MAVLTEDVQLFIVQALACFDSPSRVSESVLDEFGVVVKRTQVEKYDPTKVSGKNLSTKWRAIFETARKNFRDGITEVPIANRVYRLRMLNQIAGKAVQARNHGLTLQVLEQAAKETGDAYVNRRAAGQDDSGDEPVATQVVRSVKDARKPGAELAPGEPAT